MLDGPNISSEPRSMYKIIGADQKEYGPVTVDELRKWITEGRANGQTLACIEGGAWKPLSTFPEAAEALRAASASGTPPLSSPSFAVPPRFNAAPVVQAPGIFLMVVGALGCMLNLLNLLSHLLGWALVQTQSTGNPELDRMMQLMSGSFGLAFHALLLGLNVLVISGGWRMIQLKNYGLCIAAAVVAVVPCLSPCCCLGIPPGIWALIVLSRPEVKAVFESHAL